jgi:hypothetical protein
MIRFFDALLAKLGTIIADDRRETSGRCHDRHPRHEPTSAAAMIRR